MEELFALVRLIPAGKCASYGSLGRALDHRVSGLVVGRWMVHASPDCPWWRVIAADGSLPIAKRDPQAAREQAARLAAEGVELADDVVSKPYILSADEVFALRLE